jgi:hypothetical protein
MRYSNTKWSICSEKQVSCAIGFASRALRFSLPFKFSSRFYLLAGKATAAIPFRSARFMLLLKEVLHLIDTCWLSTTLSIVGYNELASYACLPV